ncbi:FAD-binding domain-containing protein [Zoogloea sp.]|uniref:FAD-binding domain-containing protein n=1 Tax=Zoogloea sp. TaxID=49181 RepID=UPI0026327BA9|nr:FAD-binding domain-containing protein [Zoogloea sp.]MDD3354690.1 FAD-binding domain-containing protein [Zoogloea sp.]
MLPQTAAPHPLPTSAEAALATRLAAVAPEAYARSRNHLDGAVTRLSPWITHGRLELPELIARYRLSGADTLAFEFGWREFFHHVWQHLGDGILADVRPGLPGVPYQPTLPDDIRQGRTGLPAIDRAVAELYATGYLHNHARMWLASYAVHLRKVHWRCAADWLYGHLLDGDLASNHLSWQWVAATFSSKPYLFNAANVARFAPPDWHCPGSAIDTDYPPLEALARSPRALGPSPGAPGLAEPALLAAPPDNLLDPRDHLPPDSGTPLTLVHPWALRAGPGPRLGVIHLPFHRRFPWSAARWAFVLTQMRAVTDRIWIGDLRQLQGRFHAEATLNPGYREALAGLDAVLAPPPRWLPEPPRLCSSFSRFWAACGQPSPKRRWHG